MKKTLLTLATLAIMGTSFQANATLGIATGGILGTIGVVYGGLMTVDELVLGPVMNNSGSVTVSRLLLGLLILDGENGQEVQFNKISHNDLLKMNLTVDEAIAYNNSTEELNESFKVVKSELNANSTVEDSKRLWDEQAQIIGLDAISGARKVLNFNFQQAK